MTMPMRRARGGRLHGTEPSAMLRPDPFADVQELLNRIGGLVQPGGETEADRPWVPVAEIDETDDAYTVRLELPGIAPAAIEIRIRDRELCVNGEIREERGDEGRDEGRGDGGGRNALRVRVGRFHYHASLPSDVDADNVEASMEQGILTLRIPKAQDGQGRRIEITGGRSEDARRR
jgi:HSP20 family protein